MVVRIMGGLWMGFEDWLGNGGFCVVVFVG